MGTEPLAKAASSKNLETEPGVVRDVERVAAMAGGPALGGLLFRMGPGAQPQWARRVVLILSAKILRQQHMGRDIAERTAACALWEFTRPYCETCNGARELLGPLLRVICPSCNGTGLQRFSNGARRRAIGAYGYRIDLAMAQCHREMSSALGEFLANTRDRLGQDER